MTDHASYAAELFESGYNCAQAVAVAFCDVTGMEEKAAAAMASSFGGGMGRMREVCGAVSGMLLVAGILYGYDTPGDDASKKAHYQRVQAMAAAFREEAGSIICREILKNPPSDPSPTPRSEAFYQMRPCTRMVYRAAEILDQYRKENP
jgi:C_GCAxxG_C_C family probable redox protein